MVGLLISLVKLIGLLLLYYVVTTAWDMSAMLRRRAALGTRELLRRGIGPIGRRWQVWVDTQATRRLTGAVEHLEAVVPGVPTRQWFALVEAVRAWTTFMPAAFVAQGIKLFVLFVALFNVGTIVVGVRYMVMHPPGSEPAPPCVDATRTGGHGHAVDADTAKECRVATLDPLGELWGAGRDAVGWARSAVGPLVTDPWADPMGTARALTALFLLVMVLLAMRVAVSLYRRASDSAGSPRPSARPRIRQPRSASSQTVRGGESARWQPVVVLLAMCRSVGLARRQLENRDVLHPPRISLKAAERVVWSAWRTRHGRVRQPRRGDLRKHAAKVAGALRAVEARQDNDADTVKVFEDAAALLLKIAQRYAEGRTLALLDPDDLCGVIPAPSREWVRLPAFGLIVTGTAAGALMAGLPEAAVAPLIGVVSLAAWSALYGGRMVGADLVDVMRGQSRTG
ncbi:hypothetical protein [Streptomyces sp. NPDC087856]|uniref:hypothetical protein n=1 Tax=Streptomyces sp. NPDC087856 TaxID=3365811 RepID=UPI00382DFFF5